jgi:hypothetical protein
MSEQKVTIQNGVLQDQDLFRLGLFLFSHLSVVYHKQCEMNFLNSQKFASVCSKPRKDEPKRHYEP